MWMLNPYRNNITIDYTMPHKMQMCFSTSSTNTIRPPPKQSLPLSQLGSNTLFSRGNNGNYMNIVDLSKSKGCSACGGGRR